MSQIRCWYLCCLKHFRFVSFCSAYGAGACSNEESLFANTELTYRGNVSHTQMGVPCVPWELPLLAGNANIKYNYVIIEKTWKTMLNRLYFV